MSLALLWKNNSDIKIFYNKIIRDRRPLAKVFTIVSLILIGIIFCFIAVKVYRNIIVPILPIPQKNEGFSIIYSYRFLKHIIGPDVIPMVINFIIIMFLHSKRKRFSPFVGVLFYVNLSCIFISILTAVISQVRNFQLQRYFLTPYVSWTIIYGIFAWVVFRILSSRIQKNDGSKKNIVITATVMTLVLVYGYIISGDKPPGDWALPLYPTLSDYCPSLLSAIENENIAPDKLIIIGFVPPNLTPYYLDSRVYMAGWRPDLILGETVVRSIDNRLYYRSKEGWTYNRSGYPILFDKYDLLRLLGEIQTPNDTWIAFLSVNWERLDRASEELWSYLKENFPNDGTPILAQTLSNAVDEALSVSLKQCRGAVESLE
jgi:hypothetical protein